MQAKAKVRAGKVGNRRQPANMLAEEAKRVHTRHVLHGKSNARSRAVGPAIAAARFSVAHETVVPEKAKRKKHGLQHRTQGIMPVTLQAISTARREAAFANRR